MRYDLDLVDQLCREIGLRAHMDIDRVEIDLGQRAVLCVQNAEHEQDDCRIGFLGMPWHAHGNFMLVNANSGIELDYLDLLIGLKEGRVLVCELEVEGQIVDRWLIHNEYNDEFKYLDEGERIIVRRATIQTASKQEL